MNKYFTKLLEVIRLTVFKLFPYFYFSNIARSQCHNKESDFIINLLSSLKIDMSFIEFGFQPYEFNSIELVKAGWKGLLVDSSSKNVLIANKIFNKINSNVISHKKWISLDNIYFVTEYFKSNNNRLGVLNVDVDGNDYWFLKEILKSSKPDVIVVEYNSTFGLRPITVEYKDTFNRYDFSNTGYYHGASITAFYNLLQNSYDLVSNINGLNLIFILKTINNSQVASYRPHELFSENKFRCKKSNFNHIEQFKHINHLNFVDV